MEILSFVFLCAVGALMYWFFFKCFDWLKKEEQYVYSIIYFKCSDVRLYDVCAHQAGGILIGALLLSET